jgi:SAM-dependent methyltransferase
MDYSPSCKCCLRHDLNSNAVVDTMLDSEDIRNQVQYLHSFLDSCPSSFRDRVLARQRDLRWFYDRRILTKELIAGRRVLDWECGDCAFSIALLLEGAASVTAIDSWLDLSDSAPLVSSIRSLTTKKQSLEQFCSEQGSDVQFDLVFANTVTEHIRDLPTAFTYLFKVLRPLGLFFTNHDNYYQPVGSHDHGFLYYGPGPEIVSQGVRCLELPNKCSASEVHRNYIRNSIPWTWNDSLEATRNPIDCSVCYYFRRSQPWAHLTYQDEFSRYFPCTSFTTGRHGSSLNKVTMFQLRQFVIEAGFNIERCERSTVVNKPPHHLLTDPFNFSEVELTTATYAVLASKPIE